MNSTSTVSNVRRFCAKTHALLLICRDAEKRTTKGSEWTREETDYLWSLCRQFDLRWVVIADRFDCPQHGASCRHANRSESMRARYYAIARHLAQQSVAAGQDAKKYPLLEFKVRSAAFAFRARTLTSCLLCVRSTTKRKRRRDEKRWVSRCVERRAKQPNSIDSRSMSIEFRFARFASSSRGYRL